MRKFFNLLRHHSIEDVCLLSVARATLATARKFLDFIRYRPFADVYPLSVALVVLVVSVMVPDARAVVVGGGVLHVTLLAGAVALFAATYPEASFWLTILILFCEPVLGKTTVTPDEIGLGAYYGTGVFILLGPAVIASCSNRRAIEKKAAP